MTDQGKLYIVPTPVGNLEDMTFRAIRVLKEADLILAEDTRTSGILLKHFDIKNAMQSHHKFNEHKTVEGIVSRIRAGETVALISDAGTPGISDPGARLAEAVRQAGHPVVPLPGANAAVTLLSAAGNVGRTFTFEGFLSPKKGRRRRRLEELVGRGEAFVIYESPFRVVKTLEDVAEVDPASRIVMGRELTKAFEEILCLPVDELVAVLKARPAIKGEFALVVVPSSHLEADDADDTQD